MKKQLSNFFYENEKKYQDEFKTFKSVLKLIKGTYALGIIFKKDYSKI